MATPTKPYYRFLPTLTEVVELPAEHAVPRQAIDMVEPTTFAAPPSRPAPAFDADVLIDRLMLRLNGPLQADLRNALSTLVLEHIKKLEPMLQDEIERSVRLVVEEALAAAVQDLSPGAAPLN